MASNSSSPPVLFDRALLRTRQRRAAQLGTPTFLLDRVAEDMADRVAAVLRDFGAAADIGSPGDQVRRALALRLGDIAAVALPDDERAPLALAPASLGLAVSALALQFVNDLPGVLAQIRRALKSDGLLLAAMIGGVSGVEADVIPFGSVIGNRARLAGLNVIGLKRRGFDKTQIMRLHGAFRTLFRHEGVFAQRLAETRALHSEDPLVAEILAFIDAPSHRGLIRAE